MYLCPLLLGSPLHLPPIHTPLGYHDFEFPRIIRQIPIGWLFTYVNVCASKLLSIHLSLSSPTPVGKSLLCLHLHCCSANQVHQYHPSRFCIYALIHDICFSFSDLLCIIGSRFIDLIRTESNAFLFMT